MKLIFISLCQTSHILGKLWKDLSLVDYWSCKGHRKSIINFIGGVRLTQTLILTTHNNNF